MDLEVTSVSKRAQKVSESAAAITVITNEEIRRSGMTTIPDLLRGVPGLHVAQIDANHWAVTARGFNDQFANKLLVLIDGRSAYTPLFSGVYWDVQDVVFEDIERIEVIRGPGGTLWGANAVNGVINIITKSAKDTQGAYVTAGGGNQEHGFVTGRWGGGDGEDFHYRAYVKYFNRDNFDAPGGGEWHDAWSQVRTGFRLDWDLSEKDSLTFQGDFYDGEHDQVLIGGIPSPQDVRGGNLLARFRHVYSDDADVSVQMYYDRTERNAVEVGEDRDTFDIEVQGFLRPVERIALTGGAGYRLLHDDFDSNLIVVPPPLPPPFPPGAGLPLVALEDPKDTNHLWSAFVQGEFEAIEDLLTLTAGSKFEYNSFTGFEYQPTARVLYTPGERHTLWAAVSRAVRTPSRVDDGIQLAIPSATGVTFIRGSSDFDSEEVLAVEAGYRTNPIDSVSLDVAAYYNDYEDLRSIENQGSIGPISLESFDNQAKGYGYGVEASATWQATDWWRITGTYTFMKLKIRTGSSNDATTADPDEHDTPNNQFALRSLINLPMNFELDTQVFWVGKVQSQGISSYTRFDARLGWRPIEELELSVVGQNLTDRRHGEFGTGVLSLNSAVPRSVYGKVTFRWQ
jgi:iron complex outermembrane receptor protein